MTSLPLISVYIPTFNRENLLMRAVHSVLNQTYQNLELLVVNDGEDLSDFTVAELSKDSRVRIFKTKGREGACVARNIAIYNAKGSFVTGLDDDDYFAEDRISVFLSKVQDTGHCMFFSDIKSPKGVIIKLGLSRKNFIFLEDLLKRNYIGNQVFASANLYREAGAFDEKIPAWQDYDLWLRMILRAGVAIRVDRATYVMDRHQGDRISKDIVKVALAKKIFEDKYLYYSFMNYRCYLNLSLFLYDTKISTWKDIFDLFVGVGFDSALIKLTLRKLLRFR